MTRKRSSEDQAPLSGGSRAGRKKIRRVSQRKELAVVTLGAVASITGIGGFLAANPPGWAVSDASARPAITTAGATTHETTALKDAAQKAATTAQTVSTPKRIATGSSRQQQAAKEKAARQQATREQAAKNQAAKEQAVQQAAPEQAAAQQAAQQQAAAQQAAPVYSAPSQAPAATQTQGS
ncbi:MAG: hypothetical protein ACR2GU_16530 [Rubrobacteraceae bacterium]